MTNEGVRAWWDRLTSETRQRLARDPGTVPWDLWSEVTGAGVRSPGAWWPDAQAGPDVAHLPDEVTDFIEKDNERLLEDLEVQYALHEISITRASTPSAEATEPDRHAGHFEELRIEAEARGLDIPARMRRH